MKEYRTAAVRIYPFNNPISILIGSLLIAMIASGLIGAFLGSILGSIIAIIAGCALAFGLVQHSPSNPCQAGLVTFAGSPIRIGGKNVVVAGTTILAPYIGLDTIKVDIGNKVHKFQMNILSSEEGENPVPVDGHISVIARPDVNRLEDYVQAGNDMETVFNSMAKSVYAETQNTVVKLGLSPLQICREGKKISDALESKINDDLFQRKYLGIELLAIAANFSLHEDAQSEMRGVIKEVFQRNAEMQDYETTSDSAKAMQRRAASQFIEDSSQLSDQELDERMRPLIEAGEIGTLSDYIEKIRTLRLVREGMVTRIESDGDTVNLVRTNAKFGKKHRK